MVGLHLVNLLNKGEDIMTKITTLDLAPFYRNTIGVDHLFDRIMGQFESVQQAGNYPPHDIVRTGDNTYEIRLAVAGFAQGEIDVTFHDNILTVTGEKTRAEDDREEFLHRGISARKFVRTFPLVEYIEVRNAVARDGILTIQLERVVPEEARPKSIAITYQN
jgi:molecular chaperone IbpA